jgi:bifunctional DNA-binding transcriptional regulator/antitoxin component of YhaV-PrlF toxin-antitoxin module
MKPVIVQEKSDSGALWVYIPKHIVEHFGIKKGDKLYADWDESDPKHPKIVYYLRKPERSVSSREGGVEG